MLTLEQCARSHTSTDAQVHVHLFPKIVSRLTTTPPHNPRQSQSAVFTPSLTVSWLHLEAIVVLLDELAGASRV